MKNDYENLKNLIPLFGYSGLALERFKRKIDQQDISPVYKKIIKEDKRFIIKIENEDKETLDSGWNLFKTSFYPFCLTFKINYENFFNNSFIFKKQSKKLFKACKEFSKEVKDIDKVFEKISALSLPKKDLFLILSVNLNDFILCSTKNSWTSCLNLESGTFWSSISGFLIDKNRSMIYLSDLQEKEFEGINSYKMYNRGWGLLDDKGNINVNIYYPLRADFNTDLLSKIFGFKIVTQDNFFKSKYSIKPIFNDNKVFLYGFQDYTKFSLENKKFFLKDYNKSGCFDIAKNFVNNNEIDKHENIYNLPEDIYEVNSLSQCYFMKCEICGKKEYSNIFLNNKVYCKECLKQEELKCSECKGLHKNNFFTILNEVICKKCKEKEEYVKCKKCKKYFIGNGEEVCEDCQAPESIHKCIHCQEYFESDKIYNLAKTMFLPVDKKTFIPMGNNEFICDNCFEDFCEKENIIYCEDCGNYYEGTPESNCLFCGNK